MQKIRKGQHFGGVRAVDWNTLCNIVQGVKGANGVTIRKGEGGHGWVVSGAGPEPYAPLYVTDSEADSREENYVAGCSPAPKSRSMEREVRSGPGPSGGHTLHNEIRLRNFDTAPAHTIPTQTVEGETVPDLSGLLFLMRNAHGEAVPELVYVTPADILAAAGTGGVTQTVTLLSPPLVLNTSDGTIDGTFATLRFVNGLLAGVTTATRAVFNVEGHAYAPADGASASGE